MRFLLDQTELPPGSLPANGDVHVWQFGLSAGPDTVDALRDTLNAEERARADRFFRAVHRERFTVGRGIVRALLGRYLALPPASLVFEYNANGKPALAEDCNAAGLTFNLSHSEDAAVCAVARDIDVGVDIEVCRETRDLLPIARRYFSPDEVEQLLALPPAAQRAGFYQCWTGKEALIKAWGRGLTTPLDRFTVGVRPGEAGLRSLDLPEYRDRDWRIYDIPAPAGMAAALATEVPISRILFGAVAPFV